MTELGRAALGEQGSRLDSGRETHRRGERINIDEFKLTYSIASLLSENTTGDQKQNNSSSPRIIYTMAMICFEKQSPRERRKKITLRKKSTNTEMYNYI